MLKAEFNKAVSMVESVEYGYMDGDKWVFGSWWDRFEGCGLPEFKYPVETDLQEVACFIRYQCMQMNGNLNQEALEECWQICRRKFKIDDNACWSMIDSLEAENRVLEAGINELGAEVARLKRLLGVKGG